MDYDLNYQGDKEVDSTSIANKIGDAVPATGAYECTTCGEEIQAQSGTKFPPCANCGDDHLTWEMIQAA
ncbi:MAG: zinc ribbon-containing protein [Nitrospirota bacterium]|nr:zinc ribbon-containing protein [Nitrospirota bacterium]